MRIDDIRDHLERTDEIQRWLNQVEWKIDGSTDALGLIADEIERTADTIESLGDLRNERTSIPDDLRARAREILDIVRGLDQCL